jgi:hypothetical protein
MGQAMEIITGFSTAPGTTATTLTMATGDSATIRNAALNTDIRLVQVWTQKNAAGTLIIKSTKLHDANRGLVLDDVTTAVDCLLPWEVTQRLIAQDSLTLQNTGSSTAGKIEQASLLIFYSDLPGINARLANWTDIQPRIQNIFTIDSALTLGSSGGYSGSKAINADTDNFKANTNYALLGYLVSARCTSVGWKGVDTGNMRVGGPGEPSQRFLTNYWFVRLNLLYKLPTIPIFNSANKSAITIDAAQNDSGTAVTVTSLFAELG